MIVLYLGGWVVFGVLGKEHLRIELVNYNNDEKHRRFARTDPQRSIGLIHAAGQQTR